MPPPTNPPDGSNSAEWTAFALEYLSGQLPDAAPNSLGPPALFPRSPLENEGPCLVFPFTADRAGHGGEIHYVVVGETEPNYYAAYGLNAEEAFALHIGTRFMLVLQIAQAAPALLHEYDPSRDARTILDRVAPDATLDDVSIAAAFDVDGQLHAVLSARVNGQPTYILAAEAPHGFSQRFDLPPQVIYRLHLGLALLAEPDPETPIKAQRLR